MPDPFEKTLEQLMEGRDVSRRHFVRTAGGEELTVVEQNTGSEGSSIGPGRDVLVTWQPEHTFVVNKEATHA